MINLNKEFLRDKERELAYQLFLIPVHALQGIHCEENVVNKESNPSEIVVEERKSVNSESEPNGSEHEQSISETLNAKSEGTEYVLPVQTEFQIEEADENESSSSNPIRSVGVNDEPEYSSVSSIDLSNEIHEEKETKPKIVAEQSDDGEYIPKITIEPLSKVVDPELYKDFRVPDSLILNGKNCVICGKGFKRKNNVKVHIETIHYEIRRYKCEENGCGKRFAQVSHLNVHMQAHRRRELKLQQQVKRSIQLNKTPTKKKLTFSRIIPKIILQKKDRKNYQFKLSELFSMKGNK